MKIEREKQHNRQFNTSIKPMLNIRQGSSDGRYTLVIQLIRERRRSVIFTPYRLLPAEFDARRRKAVAVNQRKAHVARIREINVYLEKQQAEISRILAEFEREGKPFTARDITAVYRQRYDNRYVHTFFQHQIAERIAEGAQGTANKYSATLTAFEKFSGGRRVHFDDIDENLLLDFEHYLHQIPLQPNTVSFYLSNFRALYNKALKRGYVTRARSPFESVPIRIGKTRKLAIGEELIRKVAQARFPDSHKLSCARDLFMFSFYCRGMSFVDMAYLRQEDIHEDVIRYRRRKTGQVYAVRIIPEVQQILDRYREECSPWALPVMLDFDAEGELRPLVYTGTTAEERKRFETQLYMRYKYYLSHYLRFYRDLSRRLDLPVRLSFNVARHSWASIARRHGIPVSVISAGLGHTSEKTTQIYLDELDNSQVDAANAMVAGRLRMAGSEMGKRTSSISRKQIRTCADSAGASESGDKRK